MEKTYTSTQKYFITSPRKLRLVAGMVKKLSPAAAIEKMPFIAKRAGEPLLKVIKSAVANAKNQGVSDVELVFKEIQIGEGPRLKRGRAVSRGRWHPYTKRMSHIRVVLTTKSEPKTLSSKKIQKQEIKKNEVKKTTRKEKKS